MGRALIFFWTRIKIRATKDASNTYVRFIIMIVHMHLFSQIL